MGNVRQHRKNGGFTMLPNAILLDNNLTRDSRNLLWILLSLPNDWKFSVEGMIASHYDVGCKGTCLKALHNLEENKYVFREQTRKANGHAGTMIYHIFDEPQLEGVHFLDDSMWKSTILPSPVERSPVERATVSPPPVKCTQDNTKLTKEKLTKEKQTNCFLSSSSSSSASSKASEPIKDTDFENEREENIEVIDEMMVVDKNGVAVRPEGLVVAYFDRKPSNNDRKRITKLLQLHGLEMVEYAFEQAVKQEELKMAYVEGILRNQAERGVMSAELARTADNWGRRKHPKTKAYTAESEKLVEIDGIVFGVDENESPLEKFKRNRQKSAYAQAVVLADQAQKSQDLTERRAMYLSEFQKNIEKERRLS